MRKIVSYFSIFAMLAMLATSNLLALQPPTQQAKYIGFTDIKSTEATVLVGMIGNGEGRIVVVRNETSPVDWTATDDAVELLTTMPAASSDWNTPPAEVVTGSFVVADLTGTGNSVTITNLPTTLRDFAVKVYEYEKNANGDYDYNVTTASLNPRTFATVNLLPPTSPSITPSIDGGTLTWTDANNATGYYLDVRLDDGAIVATYDLLDIGYPVSPGATYIITGLAQGTAYDLRLRSYDGSDISAATAWVDFTTLSDATAPTLVGITAWVGTTQISGTTPPAINEALAAGTDPFILKIVFNEEMNTNIDPTVTIDGSVGTPNDIVGGGTLTFSFGYWTTTTDTNDTYVMEYTIADTDVEDKNFDVTVANAQDKAGNPFTVAGPHATDLFDVDLKAPQFSNESITATDGTCLRAGIGFDFSLDIADGTNGSGVNSTGIVGSPALNGDTYISQNTNTWTYTYTVDAIDTDGDYEITVNVSDQAGNTNSRALSTTPDFTVDNTKPVVTATVDKTCVNEGTELTFTVTVEEDGCGDIQDSNIEFIATPEPTNGQPHFDGKNGNVLTYTYTIGASDNGDENGEYNIQIYAHDDAGNTSDNYQLPTITVDNTAPTVTATVDQTCVKEGTELTFEVTVVEDGCGTIEDSNIEFIATPAPTNGQPFYDGKTVSGNTTVLTYTYTVGPSDNAGDFDIDIYAIDDAGNESVHYELENITVDKTAPDIIDISVTDGCVMQVEGGEVEFTVSIVEEGCGTFDQNDVTVTAGTTNAPQFSSISGTGNPWVLTYTIDLDGADADGAYDIVVNATDDAGNDADQFTETGAFTVDNTAPTVVIAIADGDDCTTDADGVTFTVTVVEEGCGTYDPVTDLLTTVSSTSTNDPVLSGTVGDGSTETPWVFTYTINVADTDGDYDITVEATDVAGNASGVETAPFTVDNTAPLVENYGTIDPTCLVTGDNTFVFNFNVTETGCGTFGADQLTVTAAIGAGTTLPVSHVSGDGGTAATTYTYSVDLTGAPDGDYDIVINATDAAGNTFEFLPDGNVDGGDHEFTIDNTAPVLTVVTDPAPFCDNAGSTVTFDITVDETGCGTFDASQIFISMGANPGSDSTQNEFTTVTGTYPNFQTTLLIDAADQSGLYTVLFDATDDAGNDATQVSTTFKVDNTKPAVNTPSMTVGHKGCFSEGAEVQFTVTASDYNGCGTFGEGNIAISIESNGTSITGSITHTDQVDNVHTYKYTIQAGGTGGDQDGSYDITATVTDAAGNTNAATLTGAFNIDNTAPTINEINVLDQPICASAAAGSVVYFNVSATETSGCGAFDYNDFDITFGGGNSLNGTLAYIDEGPPQNQYNWSYTIHPSDPTGEYDIVITATDDAGNSVTETETAAFKIDNTAPDVSVAVTPACVTGADVLDIAIEASDAGCGSFDETFMTVTTSGSLTNPLVFVNESPAGTYNYTLTIDALDAEGNYDIVVNATDGAGNTITPVTDAFGIDQTAPLISNLAVSPAPNCEMEGDVLTFTFDIDEDGCSTFGVNEITIHVDPAYAGTLSGVTKNQDGSYTATYTVGETDITGTYTFSVDATDAAGNTATTESIDFNIDTTPPFVKLLGGEQGPEICLTAGDNLTFTVEASDNGCGTFDENNLTIMICNHEPESPLGHESCEWPLTNDYSVTDNEDNTYTYTVLIDENDLSGIYGVAVFAHDDAGNTSSDYFLLFDIDNDAPVLSELKFLEGVQPQVSTQEVCLTGTDDVFIELTATDEHCGTFGEADLSLVVLDAGSNDVTDDIGDAATLGFDAGSSNSYSRALTLDGDEPTGAYQIEVHATDSKGNTSSLGGITLNIDNTAPTVVDDLITMIGETCVKEGETVNFSFEILDDGCGTFDHNNMTVNVVSLPSGTPTPLATYESGGGGSGTYTYSYTTSSGNTEGPYGISIFTTDSKGNTDEVQADGIQRFYLDQTAPTATINVPDAPLCLATGDDFTFSVEYEEDGCGTLDATDITLTITTASGNTYGLTPASESPDDTFNYTYTVVAGDGTGAMTIAWSATDDAGNTNSGSDATLVDTDTKAPTLANLAVDKTCASAADEDMVTITFDASDLGCGTFDASNLTVTIADPNDDDLVGSKGTLTAGTSPAWSLTFTPAAGDETGEYLVTVFAQDDAGNTASIGPVSFNVDNTAPIVVAETFNLFAGSECITAGTRIDFTFEITEPGCGTIGPGQAKGEIKVQTSVPTDLGGNETHISGDGEGLYHYALIVPSNAPDGEHDITITLTDSKGNMNTFGFEDVFSVDNEPPVADNFQVDGGPCFRANQTVTFTFDVTEGGCGILDETNLDVSTGTTNDPAFSSVSGTGTDLNPYVFEYTVDITATDDGDYDLSVVVTDNAGNTFAFSPAGVEFTVDNTAPTLGTPMLSSTCLRASDPITIEFDAFDEGCGTFDENDITVTILDPADGTLATITPVTPSAGSYAWEATYTLPASPDNGTYTVEVTATDDAGNDATMTSAQFSVDTEAPTIDAITENIDCVGPGAEVEFTVTITEDGCGTFNRDDITVTIVGCENEITATTTDLTEVSGTHVFTYTATLTEAPTCAYDIVVNVKDDKGNTNSNLVEAAFSVDADAPELSNIDAPLEACLTDGESFTFEFDASDDGCASFGQGDITVRVYYGESLYDTYSVVPGDGKNWMFELPITSGFATDSYIVEVVAVDEFGNESTTYITSFSVDNTAPVIANFSPSDACLSSANEDSQTFTFDASDAGCGTFGMADITVTIEDPLGNTPSGTMSGLSSPGSGSYAFDYTPNASDLTGTYTIRVNADDSKGNSATELVGTFGVDNSAPYFDANDIVVVNDCVAEGSQVTIEVEITDDGCGTFGGANIYVSTGFGSASYESQDGDVFTFTVWVPETTATGTYSVTVNATDSKNNNTQVTATGVISIDADAPTLSSLDVSPDEVAPTEDVTISVDATDIGCGTFGAGDLTLTITPPSGSLNGTLSGPSVSGTTYTWVYTVTDPDAEGMYDVAVAATDGVGNSSSIGETGAFKVIYSTEPEVTSIVRKAGATNPTNAASVVYTVTFSENVSNVGDANFGLDFTGTATGTIDSFGPASGTTFDVTVSGITGEGAIRLDLDDIGTIQDDDNNALVGTYIGDEVYTIDRVLPTIVSINRDASADNPTNASSVDFIVTFSEDVNGVATGAFSTSTTGTVGGSVTSVSANPGTEYVVTVTGITGDGTLTIDLDTPSGITDDVNNVMTDTRTGDEAYTIDNTLPTVDPVLDVTNPTTAVVLFSEDVDETLAETTTNYDLTSDNGTFTAQNPTSVVYDSGTNTATITLGTPNFGVMATDETVTVTVSNVADAAGNVVDPANDEAEFTNVLAPEKLVITTVIPSQATGTAFSFTVQSQTSGGSPAPVDQDTPLDITIATGTGTLSVSGTPTILNGSSSTTVTVTYTKAGGETGVSLTADNDGGMELTAGTSNTFSILAPEPTDQADGLFFVKVKKTSVEINWVRSTDAARSIVYMRQGNNSITSSNYPVDGDAYSASSVFGSGSNINGASVVYQGTDSVVTVTGLTRLTQYNVKVDAMNGTGTASNYLTSSSSANNKSFSTPYFKASDNNGSNMAGETIVVTNVYPNPATDQFVIDLSLAVETTFSIQLFNVDGNRVADLFTNETLGSGGHNLKVNLDNFQLSSGSYQMLMTTTNNEMMIIPITIVK